MWSSIDTDKLEWSIMSDFDDISWVHINRSGTTAIVEINEAVSEPKADDDSLKGVKVLRKELESVAYRKQSRITITDIKEYRELIFFSAQIPLYFNLQQGDIEEEQSDMLTVNGVELPIGIITKTQKYLSFEEYNLTDDELEKLAEKKLLNLEEEELDGYTIVNKYPVYEIDADKCTVTCAYVVRVDED